MKLWFLSAFVISFFTGRGLALTAGETAAIASLVTLCPDTEGWDGEDPCDFTGVTCVGEAITALELTEDDCDLHHIPTTIGGLLSLTTLALSPKNGPIPSQIALLTNLQTIAFVGSVNRTVLSGVGTLHDETFADMINLASFTISYSDVRKAPIRELLDIILISEVEADPRELTISHSRLNFNLNDLATNVTILGGSLALNFEDNFITDSLPNPDDVDPEAVPFGSDASINLSKNRITGNLTDWVTLQFSDIDLSFNRLQRLSEINNPDFAHSRIILRNNSLVGTIPETFELNAATYLDLANNYLVGTVPEDVLSLDSQLDLSNNFLSGPFTYTHTTPAEERILAIVQRVGAGFCPVSNLTALLVLNTDEDGVSFTDYDDYLALGECASCGTEVTATHSPVCSSHGTCNTTEEIPYAVCTCSSGFYGDHCEGRYPGATKTQMVVATTVFVVAAPVAMVGLVWAFSVFAL